MYYEDVVRWIESKTGHALNSDEGLRFGQPARPLEKVVVCWMATVPAIEYSAGWGAQLIISHEAVFHPYYHIFRGQAPENCLAWKANDVRIHKMAAAGLSVMRCHGSADEIGLYEAFLELLGIEGKLEGEGFYKICTCKPISVRDLALKVKKAVGMEAIRVAARDLEARVSRLGFPWGGLGLSSNMNFLQRLVELGCDCFIAGESESYAMQYALDSGVPLIETSHEESENPGLKRFTEILGAQLHDAEFRFFETKRPFTVM